RKKPLINEHDNRIIALNLQNLRGIRTPGTPEGSTVFPEGISHRDPFGHSDKTAALNRSAISPVQLPEKVYCKKAQRYKLISIGKKENVNSLPDYRP
ncbi:MAG TPA: hypothetical protein VNZ45_08935, partial [Bacteroidia bacterium]|nr:hypothetical protein [Bacteroidia bacterium]